MGPSSCPHNNWTNVMCSCSPSSHPSGLSNSFRLSPSIRQMLHPDNDETFELRAKKNRNRFYPCRIEFLGRCLLLPHNYQCQTIPMVEMMTPMDPSDHRDSKDCSKLLLFQRLHIFYEAFCLDELNIISRGPSASMSFVRISSSGLIRCFSSLALQ